MGYLKYFIIVVLVLMMSNLSLYATGTTTGTVNRVFSDDRLNPEMINTLEAVNILDLSGHSENGEAVNQFIITSLPRAEEGVLYMADGVTRVSLRQTLTLEEANGLRFDPQEGFVGNVIFTYMAVDDNGVKGNSAIVTIPLVSPHTTTIVIHSDVGIAHGGSEPIVIDVLENDRGNLNGATVRLIGENGTLTDTLRVEGEGVWSVNENNQIIFTPVAPFAGTPTPISYQVQDATGATSNSATVRIRGRCVCDAYEKSVSSLSRLSLLLMILLTFGMAETFMRESRLS